MLCSKLWKTASMSSQSATNGGAIYLVPNYLLRVAYLVPLLLLWRTLMADGVDAGMSLSQMLTYTYLGALFAEILVVKSPASNWFYEGLITSLYQRPLGILTHLTAQTVGGWFPQLALFILPMLFAAPLFGVDLIAHSLWFIPSVILCISLGFAIDFIFACLTIRMINASWVVYVIRNAVVTLLSGSVIPFIVFPWDIGKVLQFLPFGSLAGAPLALYTGLASPIPILLTQVWWNLLLWPMAIWIFRKSQERMVSHGG